MITQSVFQTPNKPLALLQRAWGVNRPITILIITTLATTILAIIGMALDPRMLLGQSIWAKTFKFSTSMVVYGATLLWFASYIPRSRWFSILLNVSGVILLLEIVIIIFQAVRGQMMHFNYSTPLDAGLFVTMAATIYTLWGVSIVTGLAIARKTIAGGKVFAWSIRLGMLLGMGAGFGLGTLMVTPTAEQMTLFESGDPAAGEVIGGHTVGAPDGGEGLPILGWSTTHGDLRIPHFFGLHALQLIPLVGLLITNRREKWLSENHRLALVIIAAAAYSGFVGLTAWQALRAESIVNPSGTTLFALVALAATTLLGVSGTLWHARRSD